MDQILLVLKKIIPRPIFDFFQPTYHYLLVFLAALVYGYPSRKIIVVAVTGTKGKTSTLEILNAILTEAGYKTALASTLRFKIGEESNRNMYKMTMPGRFVMQKFLKRAVKEKCQYALLEVTSQAVLQYRHRFINYDALIFTNLSPEHIESHGSYEKYVEAKLEIAKALAKSPKERKILVVNGDDKESGKFMALPNIDEKEEYSLKMAEPYQIGENDISFTLDGEKLDSHLAGIFNLYNILGAATFAKTQAIGISHIKNALKNFKGIQGRVEYVSVGQGFKVVIDYAHTPDSLEKLYDVFQNRKRICVLGNTGGGRDKWKRKNMAQLANKHCSFVVLTNEDPYDEDPEEIIEDMAKHIDANKLVKKLDRREAIRLALKRAEAGDAVLITGKGTDPYIMGADGTKISWSDSEVAKEELEKLLEKSRA